MLVSFLGHSVFYVSTWEASGWRDNVRGWWREHWRRGSPAAVARPRDQTTQPIATASFQSTPTTDAPRNKQTCYTWYLYLYSCTADEVLVLLLNLVLVAKRIFGRSRKYIICTFCYFLSRVSTMTRDIDIAIPSVRYVPVFYETAKHSVMVSSPYGSPIILVSRESNSFAKLRRNHPLWGAKYR